MKDQFLLKIKNGKIREYYGFSLTDFGFAGGIKPSLNWHTVNHQYVLTKLHKWDREEKSVKGNYTIEFPARHQISIWEMTIKLNWIQKLILDWGRKESFIHKNGVIQEWVKWTCVALPIILISYLIKCQTSSPTPNSNTMNHAVKPPITLGKKNIKTSLNPIDSLGGVALHDSISENHK